MPTPSAIPTPSSMPTRRLLVTALLFAGLIGLSHALPAQTGLTAASLLEYGFLILAAFAAGDLAEAVGVPRVTAYLLTGLLVGPDAAALIRDGLLGPVHRYAPHAQALPLTALAIGFMGLRAGAGLDLRAFLRNWRPTLTLLTLQTGGVLLLCAAALGLLFTAGLASIDTRPDAWIGLAALAAVLMVGGSPSATVAVLDETGSRGPIGQQALQSAALRELILPILAFSALALAGAESPEVSAATLLPWIGLLAGLATGVGLWAIRWANAKTASLMTVTAVAVVSLAFANHLPTGPLLIFLVAGAVLGNVGRLGAEVLSALGPIATPVYVFFFASLGATFPLAESTGALPAAFVLATARLLALVAAGRVNGRLAGLPHHQRAVVGLGALPHAGSAVGLAILAGEVIPATGPFIRDAALGAILLSEALGPFALQQILRLTGEYVSQDDLQDTPPALAPAARLARLGAELPPPPLGLDPALSHPLRAVRQHIQEEMDDFADALALALTQGPFGYLAQLAPGPSQSAPTLPQWATETTRYVGQSRTLATLHQALDALNRDLGQKLQAVRPTSVPETAQDRLPNARDSRWARAQKFGQRLQARLGMRKDARRTVRLDHLVAHHLTSPLPDRLVPITHLAMRVAVLPLEEVRRRLRDPDGLRAPDPQALDNLRVLADEVLARAMLLFSDAMDAIYRDAVVAGTPTLPNRALRPPKPRHSTEAQDTLQNAVGRWEDITAGQAGRALAHMHALIAAPQIETAFQVGAATTTALIDQALVEPLRRIEADATAALTQCEQLLQHPNDATATLPAIRDTLLAGPTKTLRALDRRRNRGELTGFLTPLCDTLRNLVLTLPGRLSLPQSGAPLPPEGLTPDAGHAAIAPCDIHEIATAVLVEGTAITRVQVEERVAALVLEKRAGVAQIAQIVRFHLDASAESLSDGASTDSEQLAREFALGGLQRVTDQLRELLAALAAARQELSARVITAGQEAQTELVHLLVDLPPEAVLSWLRARRQTTPLSAPDRAGAAVPELLSGWKQHLTQLVQSVAPPPAPTSIGFPFHIAEHATIQSTRNLGLPESYRRLFSFNPVGLDDFFVGRQRVATALDEAIRRFLAGTPSAVLVLGRRGAGRSSLVNRALRHRPKGVDVIRTHITRRISTRAALTQELAQALGLPRTLSPKRLVEHLATRQAPLIVVLDPLERLHLRNRQGLEALQDLGALIGATAHRVLWIAMADPDALRAMTALTPIDTAFTDTLTLPPLDPVEVGEFVLTRHAASGYHLRFDPGPEPASELDLKTRFFQSLQQRSGGEPLRVVFNWLRSLHLDSDGKTMVAKAPPALDLTALALALDPQDLLLLAQVHAHGGLTINELPAIASVVQQGAAMRLRRLAWRHFLSEPEAERFVINPIVWPAVHAALHRGGVL